MTYSIRPFAGQSKQRTIIFSVVLFTALIGILLFGLHRYYQYNLTPVNPNAVHVEQFAIESGESTRQIAERLENQGIIRAAWAFAWYMRTEGLSEAVRFGSYQVSQHMSAQDLAALITGDESVITTFTIFPERRLDQIRDSLIEEGGFEATEVDTALEPQQYSDHPALVDKPANASLEGYLYPETFQIDNNTTAQDIIRLSLDQMAEALSPDIKDGIRAQGLSIHDGIILASIVEREVDSINPQDRPRVAQVFYSRLEKGMRLESDATAPYGAVLAGLDPREHRSYNSAYNTYRNEGLTPTPISNVSQSSLEAVASPANTDYLFFVSGDRDDDGISVTHFSRTLEEHNRLIQQHCTELCR